MVIPNHRTLVNHWRNEEMAVASIIENLSYEKKREICVDIIKDDNSKNSRIELTDKYLEACIEGFLLKYSQECKKGILQLWLSCVNEILDRLHINETIQYMKDVLKEEISSILQSDDISQEYDGLDDRVESICRNLVLLLSEGNFHPNNSINIKNLIENNYSVASTSLVRPYDKDIKRNKRKRKSKLISSIIFLPFGPEQSIDRILNLTKYGAKNRELKIKKGYLRIVFMLYINTYLNRAVTNKI